VITNNNNSNNNVKKYRTFSLGSNIICARNCNYRV